MARIPSRTYQYLRRASLAGSCAPALVLLLPPATPAPPRSPSAPQTVIATDTIRPTVPRLFERRVIFSPDYLTRLFASGQRGALAIEAPEAAESRRLAATYARRYRIGESLAHQIVETALAERIDPELAFRLVRAESRFLPAARGPAGALGLTQLMPSTARAIDRSLRSEADILDPETNLRTGFRYLRRMIERYGGDVRLGLLAYNRGELAVDRALRAGRDPENGYSAKVLGSNTDRYAGSGIIP